MEVIYKLRIIHQFGICTSRAHNAELVGTVLKPLLMVRITVDSKMTLSKYGRMQPHNTAGRENEVYVHHYFRLVSM
jgi:hypothetical protein